MSPLPQSLHYTVGKVGMLIFQFIKFTKDKGIKRRAVCETVSPPPLAYAYLKLKFQVEQNCVRGSVKMSKL